MTVEELTLVMMESIRWLTGNNGYPDDPLCLLFQGSSPWHSDVAPAVFVSGIRVFMLGSGDWGTRHAWPEDWQGLTLRQLAEVLLAPRHRYH